MKNKFLKLGGLSLALILSLGDVNEILAEENDEVAEFYMNQDNVQQIDESQIPDDVVPLYFETAEEAENYLELEQNMEEEGKELDLSVEEFIYLYDENMGAINLSEIELSDDDFSKVQEVEYDESYEAVLSENTNVKTKTVNVAGISSITVYATYTYANSKFSSVKSVTSSYNGLTLGNSWVQDTYSSSISKSGKKLTVHVYGHMNHYIIIDWGILRVGSTAGDFETSWNY